MKLQEYKTSTLKQFIDLYPHPPKRLSSAGNKKIGIGTISFSSLSTHGTCAGKTQICDAMCYDATGRSVMFGNLAPRVWYEKHLLEDISKLKEIIEAEIVLYNNGAVRLKVGGDFGSEAEINMWVEILKNFPQVEFWGYTRAWRVKELAVPIARLRDQPNMMLLASVDAQTGFPDDYVQKGKTSGWRLAYMGDAPAAPNSKDVVCPEIEGKVNSCRQCNLCIGKNFSVGIRFPLHGNQKGHYEKILAEGTKNNG